MTKHRWKVIVHSGFNEQGIWIIDAEVLYAGGMAPPRDSPIRKRARRALDKAVQKEKLRGLHFFGAQRVRVNLHAFEDQLDFPLHELLPSSVPPPDSD